MSLLLHPLIFAFPNHSLVNTGEMLGPSLLIKGVDKNAMYHNKGCIVHMGTPAVAKTHLQCMEIEAVPNWNTQLTIVEKHNGNEGKG